MFCSFEILRSGDNGKTVTSCKTGRGKSVDGAYIVSEKLKALYLRPAKALLQVGANSNVANW